MTSDEKLMALSDSELVQAREKFACWPDACEVIDGEWDRRIAEIRSLVEYVSDRLRIMDPRSYWGSVVSQELAKNQARLAVLLCQSCKAKPGLPLHICAYSEELYPDDTDRCNCCDDCAANCALDV